MVIEVELNEGNVTGGMTAVETVLVEVTEIEGVGSK